MVDGTYRVNKVKFPLYTIMVKDGNGRGQAVAQALVADERKDTLINFFSEFKRTLPPNKVKTFIVDKDFNKIDVIQTIWPGVQVSLCRFHVLKTLCQEITKLHSPSGKEEVLKTYTQKLVYAKSSEEYNELHNLLINNAPEKLATAIERSPGGLLPGSADPHTTATERSPWGLLPGSVNPLTIATERSLRGMLPGSVDPRTTAIERSLGGLLPGSVDPRTTATERSPGGLLPGSADPRTTANERSPGGLLPGSADPCTTANERFPGGLLPRSMNLHPIATLQQIKLHVPKASLARGGPKGLETSMIGLPKKRRKLGKELLTSKQELPRARRHQKRKPWLSPMKPKQSQSLALVKYIDTLPRESLLQLVDAFMGKVLPRETSLCVMTVMESQNHLYYLYRDMSDDAFEEDFAEMVALVTRRMVVPGSLTNPETVKIVSAVLLKSMLTELDPLVLSQQLLTIWPSFLGANPTLMPKTWMRRCEQIEVSGHVLSRKDLSSLEKGSWLMTRLHLTAEVSLMAINVMLFKAW